MQTVTRLLAALIDWIAGWHSKPPAASPLAAPAVVRVPEGATPHRRFGGRAWRWDGEGVHAEGRLWRTVGEPVTCRAILALHGDAIHAAARRYGVAPALIVMTIATETAAARHAGFTGPATFRWERHVLNRDVAVPFRGSYSAGPMQVLATTARDLIRREGPA
ncbi:MAG TPA: hypothetical protein GYA10_08975, partial [Alphaproteobacteria bacterium]|nr:hypothetical protein [Alphaproteobacteria bacterium]